MTDLADDNGLCWYCGERAVAVGAPLEHVVPAAIGGELTTPHVCFACNQKASSLDQQFVQDWFILERRLRFNILDRQGNPPPHPRGVQVRMEDGTPARIDMRDGKFEVQPVAQIHDLGEGRFTVSAATEEEARAKIAELEKRYASEGAKFDVASVERRQIPPGRVQVSLKARQGVKMRMYAKLAIAAASLVADESWVRTEEAALLRRWFRGDDLPRDAEGILAEPPALPILDLVAGVEPPTHLLLLKTFSPDRTMFVAGLFGSIYWTGTFTGLSSVDVTWLIDPVARAFDQTNFEGLMTRSVLAIQRTSESESLDGDS